jgi:hypothetical protein
MRQLLCPTAVLALVVALPQSGRAAPVTQGFLFQFSKPRANGKVILNFFDANRSFDAIKVTVSVTKQTSIETKRNDILTDFIQAAAMDISTLGWAFNTVPKDPGAFTLKNVPKYVGKTLVNIEPAVIDRSSELVNHVDRLAGTPNNRGFITFASASFNPVNDGHVALFHAGVDYDGTDYFAQISATALGSDLSGQHVAELLYQQLAPQVSSFATISDPELTGSDSLIVQLLPTADPNAVFGVSFGTTSLSGYVEGGLLPVPEPGTLALATVAGACGLASWWRRRRAATADKEELKTA